MENVINHNSQEIKELLFVLDEATESLEEHKPQTSLEGETFLNNRQVCEKLHISQRTLQDYRDRGYIAFYKLEGKILYAESDILKMLEDNYYKAWSE